ncbi:MAG: hypothetical protein VCD00_09000 [Candidatus Hydrogenedentota bacterium]
MALVALSVSAATAQVLDPDNVYVNASGSVFIGLTLDLPDAFTTFVTREIPIRITE